MIDLRLRALMAIGLALLSCETARAMSLEVLLDQVRHRYAQINTLTARFEQRNYQAAITTSNWFYGRLYFMKPQNLKIQVSEPDNQIIIVDSSQVWIYVPILKQVTVQPRPRDITTQTLLSMLMGIGDPREDFKVEWDQSDVPDTKGRYQIVLTPLVLQQGLDKIVVAVDSKTYYMVDFSVNDRMGNSQNIELKDIQIDQPLSAELFHMKIPEGTAVISPPKAPGGQP
jgi:outer membrane lipoprotein carrier protein